MVRSTGRCDEAFLSGETTDISETGIGFIVAAIRIKENYLVGQDKKLNVELDDSGRKIRIQVQGVRYEKVGIHQSTERYLIGAQVVAVNEDDKDAYAHLLQNGPKADKSLSSVLEVRVE